MNTLDVAGVMCLFHAVSKTEVDRPAGNIEFLIGYEYAGFHPVRMQSSDHLLLLGNQFLSMPRWIASEVKRHCLQERTSDF